ncbi:MULTISPECIES: DUF3859 domain-containing protein [unclassified Pseudomonas]|uniref:DUF3859 domain-containing protein n=1 Tax=unclassified Pseudomonas TaxID=196821 RepID=UPI00244B7D1D|nr:MULTISPECIES: DUF3859 domain-containing protein [unclassified Pseudomonas]MDG9928800.1 DUF3859 domain-containing protein [Pseudomonas sp. GD04042]MDH0481869.1 DUF3859 domain-containing protein [Pseudomonas sp. GD04015]MDH0603241.1 DUF3859 domain-containing protein [Pseudomonas sp. GD03869]
MKNAMVFFLAVALAGCSENNAELLKYGIAKNVVIQTIKDKELVSGEKHIVASCNIVEETQKVPAKLGSEFGIVYKIGRVDFAPSIRIEEVIIFPDGGVTNPETGRNVRFDSELLDVSPNTDLYFSYTLDYPWEIKVGTWVFQVRQEGEVLVEKEFYIE